MSLLKIGSTGDAVKALQRALTAKGYSVGDDGDFGQNTFKAVIAFQKKVGLNPDGVVGKDTSDALGLNSKAVWETLPFPVANRSRAAAMPTLEAVARLTGVSAKLLATFASIESAFDYTVKPSTSSAEGWFQILDATWDALVKAYGAKYGIMPDPKRTLRKDPRANALMGAELLAENTRALKKALGREPTDVELYAAHFFGAGTAGKFLSAVKSAQGKSLFPAQAKANPGIFYAKYNPKLDPIEWQPRTVAEIIALFEKKVSAHRG